VVGRRPRATGHEIPMFDEVTRRSTGTRAARRGFWLGASSTAQAALVFAILVLYRPSAPPPKERVVEVKFVKGAALPATASRPSPPPPAVRKPVPRERKVLPQSIPAMVQPKEVAPEIPAHDPEQPHDLDEEGTEDGVVGGMVGGEAGAALAPPPPPEPQDFNEASMTRPVLVSGPELSYTRRALEREVEGLMIVKCVVTISGAVRNCQVLQGLPYMDDAVLEALAHRRYRPATQGGRPVEVNYLFRINLKLPRAR
jgi:protein TonB